MSSPTSVIPTGSTPRSSADPVSGTADAPPIELEVKAVVSDPVAVMALLASRGAVVGFLGLMEDRRFDRAGELARRDEVLRVRTFRYSDGRVVAALSWKGRVSVTPDGYKRRPELEYRLESGESEPAALCRALGFDEVHRIDRRVAYLSLAGATLRLEWYPRMDVLLEIEGTPASIEAAIVATGIPRDRFSADPLAAFVARFVERTGRSAVLSLEELGSDTPTWAAAS